MAGSLWEWSGTSEDSIFDIFSVSTIIYDELMYTNGTTFLHDFVRCHGIICISVPLFTWLMSREWYDDDVCMSSIFGWNYWSVAKRDSPCIFLRRRIIYLHILPLNYYNSSAEAGAAENALLFDGVNLAQKLSLHFCGWMITHFSFHKVTKKAKNLK